MEKSRLYPDHSGYGGIFRKRGGVLFKIQLAQYINDNLALHNLTYKQLGDLSGVPPSSIHAYAQGKVNNPDEENLLRIIKAFGDPPETLQQMRRAALPSTLAENKLIAGASDQERMEEFAALMRSNMLSVLEDYRAASASQQTEIIQHADQHVEEERARFKERAAEVVKQCNEEMERNKAFYDQSYQMTIAHCDQRIADIKAHMDDIVQEKRDAEKKMSRQYARNRAYLRSSVRNLCIACGILLITNIFFGAYAIFAYTEFDMHDPSRGLLRETHSIGPMMLFLAIVAICIAGALVVSMLANKPKHEEEEE